MLSLRVFWRRHRKKIVLGLGVLGSGYVLFKLYRTHRERLTNLEREFEEQRETDELIKAQLQAHFENIQRISDSMTLPYALDNLRSRIFEELDLSELTERLMQGKGRPNTLTSWEKLELWERLKILSFTRTASSLWAMTMLSLYIRVQVNILGRHLYIDTARGLESSQALDEADQFDTNSEREFLATADYLSNCGMNMLIPTMQRAARGVLKDTQLRDPFSPAQLYDALVEILELFMSMGVPRHWVGYMVPENTTMYKEIAASNGSDDSIVFPNARKLQQLMVETRAVLSSDDFENVADITLKKVVEQLTEEIAVHSGGDSSAGIPLAKLLPRVVQTSSQLLEEPKRNKFIQIIHSLPEVELFYTLLYANMPLVS